MEKLFSFILLRLTHCVFKTKAKYKKNNWLASFFQKFYGREGSFYFLFGSRSFDIKIQ